jgi:putative phage-type endonuclease
MDAAENDRRSGIGGSDAPAVLGLSKYKTPFELYLEKRGEIQRKPVQNEAARWGTVLEPAIIQEYAERTGRTVRRPFGVIRHSKLPYMTANIDGFTDDGTLLEVKTARTSEGWGVPGSAEIPEAYLIQVQHYFTVTELRRADIAVLIGGQDFRIYHVDHDDELERLIVEAEAQFWTGVVKGNPPDARTTADMSLRFRNSTQKATAANEYILDVVRQLNDIRAKRDGLDGIEESLKVLVMGYLGNADTLINCEGKPLVTWKSTKPRSAFDRDRFGKDHPDLLAEYTIEGESHRRFLLK